MHEEPQYDSQTPDPHVPWCSKCQAHTTSVKRYVEDSSGGGSRRTCCCVCKSYLLRYAPAKIGESITLCRKAAMVLGSIMLVCVAWVGWTGSGAAVPTIALVLLAPCFLFAIGLYIWFVYLQSRWRSWVKLRGQQSPSKHD